MGGLTILPQRNCDPNHSGKRVFPSPEYECRCPMRLLRFVLCVVILAAVAAAQSTTPITPSNPGPIPETLPQQPQAAADQPASQQQQQQAQQAEQRKASSFDV